MAMKYLNQYITEKFKINKNTKFRDLDNWSIFDAEDGDIVQCFPDNEIIFIYKCLNTNHTFNRIYPEDIIIYHVLYIENAIQDIDIGPDIGVGMAKRHQYKLATDEQCQNLFKALKKKGYKWDEHKKEIIKI